MSLSISLYSHIYRYRSTSKTLFFIFFYFIFPVDPNTDMPDNKRMINAIATLLISGFVIYWVCKTIVMLGILAIIAG
tara:strand:+ start:145 stop:375 length:231 start_codon:yes stop_codon:yes gene_type:complete